MPVVRSALSLLTIFVTLAVVSILAIAWLGVELSHDNYWNYHGVWLLIFLALFPRLALLFSSIPFGGVLWWLGWIVCPRYLVAVLATISYWPTNAFLVSMAWFVALGGEVGEKFVLRRTYRRREQRDENIIDMKLQ